MASQNFTDCEYCNHNEAEIFQVTGNYCIECWQEETHPRLILGGQ